MKNDPNNWEEQTWSIPNGALVLRRRGKEWYLSDFAGHVRIEVSDFYGRMMSDTFSEIHKEEDWIYRHSLQFRWLRFWYRIKKKREAKST
jgi:hypothetical protein